MGVSVRAVRDDGWDIGASVQRDVCVNAPVVMPVQILQVQAFLLPLRRRAPPMSPQSAVNSFVAARDDKEEDDWQICHHTDTEEQANDTHGNDEVDIAMPATAAIRNATTDIANSFPTPIGRPTTRVAHGVEGSDARSVNKTPLLLAASLPEVGALLLASAHTVSQESVPVGVTGPQINLHDIRRAVRPLDNFSVIVNVAASPQAAVIHVQMWGLWAKSQGTKALAMPCPTWCKDIAAQLRVLPVPTLSPLLRLRATRCRTTMTHLTDCNITHQTGRRKRHHK